MDHLTRKKRSENMSRIRSKNTNPELAVRRFLKRNRIKYQSYPKGLVGKPDLLLAGTKNVIFVHGCFWHKHKRCKRSNIPKSNKTYWVKKIESNISRDKKNVSVLKKQGWNPVIIWECETKNPEMLRKKIKDSAQDQYQHSEHGKIKAMTDSKYVAGSLYAGIGGICWAFKMAGAEILWANEFDNNACRTYMESFKECKHPKFKLYDFDVHKLSPQITCPVDILTSGFPCQAFSVAGHQLGFKDERGLHFFQTMKFLDVEDSKKPAAFLFENVKNLISHDHGKTFQRIREEVKKRNYSFVPLVLNTMEYGNIPQTRERVYMVGFKNEAKWQEGDDTCTAYFDRNKPQRQPLTKKIRELLDVNIADRYYYDRFQCYGELKRQIQKKDTIYQWRRIYVRENKSSVCPTLTANMGTGGHNVPLILDGKRIRKLTPRECARFQGFEDWQLRFPAGMSDSHLYKQIGNSVSIPVVYELAKTILAALHHKKVMPHVFKISAETTV